jgi:hypothetical protein
MKARGGMFLNYEAANLGWRDGILAAGFGGFVEVALGLIGGKFAIRRHDKSFTSRYIFSVAALRGHRTRLRTRAADLNLSGRTVFSSLPGNVPA